MNCPSCGASIHLEDGAASPTCEYCKAVYLPEKNDEGVRVFDQPSELSCPICRASLLLPATLARQRILYCLMPHSFPKGEIPAEIKWGRPPGLRGTPSSRSFCGCGCLAGA